MDDDFKDFKRNKPQQKLYKPGSGPLRKTSYGSDSKANVYDAYNGSRGRDHYGSKSSIYEEDLSPSNAVSYNSSNNRNKRYEHSGKFIEKNDADTVSSMRSDDSSQFTRKRNDKQNLSNSGSYGRGAGRREGKNNDTFTRSFRQTSEPRSSSPMKGPRGNEIVNNHNRDSRSMETSAGRQMSGAGSKPPSGRRNSAGYPSDTFRPKHNMLDHLPPRLKKKFLEQSGHQSLDHVDYSRDQCVGGSVPPPPVFSSNNWSQTLPSRGRGRMRDCDLHEREKLLNIHTTNYENQGSRKSTPSNSCLNLYEPTSLNTINVSDHNKKQDKDSGLNNGYTDTNQNKTNHNREESVGNAVTVNSTNFADLVNLDWSAEVDKELCESGRSTPSVSLRTNSISQDIRGPMENKNNEPRESKRKSSRHKDRKGSNRSNRPERRRRDEPTETGPLPNVRERERRDSHKSNRSSTIGNSRDDLDRWRSLRSFSREHSTEGRIVSQCNSRDVSANRATSPRDLDGFRVPSNANKNTNWNPSNQKRNHGRPPSSERGRQGPSNGGAHEGSGGGGGGGGGRKSRKSGGRHRGGGGGGHNSENNAPSAPPAPLSHTTTTNWREEIIESKKHGRDRHDSGRNRLNSCQSDKSETSANHPGLLVLPQGALHKERPREVQAPVEVQKMLFDHHNPSKPIIVQTNPSNVDSRMDRGLTESWARMCDAAPGPEAVDAAEAQRAARHRSVLIEIERADAILQTFMLRGPLPLAEHWADIAHTRKFLQNSLQKLLLSDLKYCQADNVEHRFWKMLYHNFIEFLRKSIPQIPSEDKHKVVELINNIIEEGNAFFENLVQLLEKTYKFNTDDYINGNHVVPPKGLGYIGLALIAVQKLYLFLGDLARYKEQVNETNNFAKSKFWYTKAQQINPKNGRPYNQLAILAVYAKRKLDAVYYYMRSLMSSNPFQSARESLISLFDENRKKYEAAERKRRAANESANPDGEKDDAALKGSRIGREIWIRPGASRATAIADSKYDDLARMTPVELNKSFITSYLHVHGKLVTKIGMESFHTGAALMLRQFRALLRLQPLPIPGARLLHLTALNMFSVEATAAASVSNTANVEGAGAGERSAWLECALSVSLLMFGAMLERCCALLPEDAHTQQHADALLLLPAIKVWSDWMLCHSSKWNPPPSFDNYDTGSENDPWDWLAKLMNILEALDDKTIVFETDVKEGYECVGLSEDAALAGFTPLMYMEPAAATVRPPSAGAAAPAHAPPPHLLEHALRARKLLFFGTEFLVGVEPPVLKLEYPIDQPPRYVSAVPKTRSRANSLRHLSEESEGESIETSALERANPSGDSACPSDGRASPSEDRGSPSGDRASPSGVVVTDEATRRLLRRKEQLEAKRANLERRKEKLQEVLGVSGGGETVEVRPRWLVPDTNCFIEHLPLLQRCVAAPFSLAVPLVVVNELEGLRKCSRVGSQAAAALTWLSPAGGSSPRGVRFATSRGSLLASRAFTAEQGDDDAPRATNDDRVLATALSLHANSSTEPGVDAECGGPRVRSVVLLTEDRNLRVKALAAELPARDLPAFLQWAAIPPPPASTPAPATDVKCSGDAPKQEGDR